MVIRKVPFKWFATVRLIFNQDWLWIRVDLVAIKASNQVSKTKLNLIHQMSTKLTDALFIYHINKPASIYDPLISLYISSTSLAVVVRFS